MRILGLLLLLTSLSSGLLKAETLEDVITSEAYNKVDRDTQTSLKRRQSKRAEENWLRGIQPGTNFAMLFEKIEGPHLLHRWLNASHMSFRMINERAQRQNDMAIARIELQSQKAQLVFVNVYVPHPTYYPMVQLKVIRQFTAMEPPLLQVTHEEKLDINGIPARLFYTQTEGCSLLLKLEKYSIIRIHTNSCKDVDLLPKVARELDLDRFNKKLNS